MNRAVKATLWAMPPIILLVIIPYLIFEAVPTQYISMVDSTFSISIASLVFDLAVFGILLATFSFLQTWAYRWTMLKPIASSIHAVVSYTLLLFILGFGNPLAFGTANITISSSALGSQISTSGMGAMNISIISTLIALLIGIAVVIKVAHAGLKYREDRRFHELDLQDAAAQAVKA